jgi:DNA-binding helix-hairpin-helix protein with protein kinase domain
VSNKTRRPSRLERDRDTALTALAQLIACCRRAGHVSPLKESCPACLAEHLEDEHVTLLALLND